MSQSPFFSIIIPVYNAADYLKECLQSILSQDFDDWEAVIVDDCSADRSLEVAQEFSSRDCRIKVFESQKNSGGAYAPRLRAANLASGRFLVIIDADDFVSSNLLSHHYRKIMSVGADLVIPNMWKRVGSDSHKILPLAAFDDAEVWAGKSLVAHTLCRWEFPMAGFAVRRDLYLSADKLLSLNDRKSIFSDELLSRWILYLCEKVAFDDARYFYRLNPDSVTNTNAVRFVADRLITCNSLVAMTEKSFGSLSSTYLKALENKFFTAVSGLRIANSLSKRGQDVKTIEKNVAGEMKDFPYQKLKAHISPRYFALMKLPVSWARRALKVLDPIIAMRK